jgi:Fe2+ or Zn2+ uptake regulation protein
MVREDMKKVSPAVIAEKLGTSQSTVYRTLRNYVDGKLLRKTVLAENIITVAERVIDSYELEETE